MAVQDYKYTLKQQMMHYDKVQCTEQTLKHVINYGIAQDSKHTLTQQIKIMIKCSVPK